MKKMVKAKPALPVPPLSKCWSLYPTPLKNTQAIGVPLEVQRCLKPRNVHEWQFAESTVFIHAYIYVCMSVRIKKMI